MRRKRIILTVAYEGGLYEEPRIQALARLQPIRVLANGHVQDEYFARAGCGLYRPRTAYDRMRKRWWRRHYGSHSRRILRDAEERRRMDGRHG